MNGRGTRFLARLLLLGAMLASLGIAACGDSDDGDSSAATNPASSTEREAVAAVMPQVRDAFNDMDGKAFCSHLTAAGRQEVSGYASEPPVQKAYHVRDCAKFITKYTRVVVPQGGAHKRVRILKVDVNGDKAAVTMKGGLAGIRSIATYKLAKDGGEWKVEDPISGAQTRRLPEELQQKIQKDLDGQ